MTNERLHSSLQENILALLAYSDEHGKALAHLVDTNLFEGEYRTVAERLVSYWRRYGVAPKAAHTGDLFSDILEDKASRRSSTIKRMLTSLDELWSLGVNEPYVVSQYGAHVRVMLMKSGILKAAEKIQSGQELAIAETEEILNDLLRSRQIHFDEGTRLDDYDKLLDYMDRKYAEFTTGVKQLDEGNIVPSRAALLMLIAAAKIGKSWWLVNLGKQAFLQRKKVAHISLEMAEEEIQQRYWQCLFSIAKRHARALVTVPRLRIKDEKLVGIDSRDVKAAFTFDDPGIRMELATRLEVYASQVGNIVIKRFPPRSLTPNGIRGYLDNLETLHRFIPDLLIVDYAGLMKTDTKVHRIETGRNVEELRAIAVERNIAVATAHQSNRAGSLAGETRATHASEDWSIVQTADTILTFSRTDEEKKLGLGRLYVDMARGEEDGWGVIVTQALELGQFVLDSAPLTKDYWDFVTPVEEEDESEE